MKEMRRSDRVISEPEAYRILVDGEFGVLSTISINNTPYGIPLNYCVIDQSVYFHCALEGEKINNINYNSSVSFSVIGKTRILPESFGTLYESVIVHGSAIEIFNENKQTALEGLLKKYSPDYLENGIKYIKAMYDKTAVYKIDITEISGKSRKG